MSAVAEAPQRSDHLPAAFATLAERYDPCVIDLYAGEARIRLESGEGHAWDALVSDPGIGFVPRRSSASPTRC